MLCFKILYAYALISLLCIITTTKGTTIGDIDVGLTTIRWWLFLIFLVAELTVIWWL